MSQDDSGRPTAEQQVKTMLAALAFGSLAAAAAIYVFRRWLGIPDDTAQMVSLVFVLVAAIDGLMVYFWDRIFKRSS
jgi:hypothetical protein